MRDSNPAGDWVADGGSDCRNDAGEEGGAMKGSTMAVEGPGLSLAGAGAAAPAIPGSGTSTAWPIRLLF